MKISAAFAILLAVQPASAWMEFLNEATKPKSVKPLTGLPPGKDVDNKNLDNIFAQNQVWKNNKLKDDPEFFNKLGSTHKPEFMWIGCSDARVPPNVVIGEDAGNVFVNRNVANMVVNTDSNLMSAIQYGVGYLGVKHIIICGHYECGGVRAAEVHNDFVAPLELWLRNIRDVYATHRVELDAIEDADVRHRRLVDLNVIQQAVNVMKTEPVQAKRKETYADGEAYISPLIHAMVFDPKSGVLKRLDVDFKKYEKELASVYGLYTI